MRRVAWRTRSVPFRHRHLLPVPAVASLASLNQLIAVADMIDDGRMITDRSVTIAAVFSAEQPAMLPLRAEPGDPARLLEARVHARARVCVRQNYYSVPLDMSGGDCRCSCRPAAWKCWTGHRWWSAQARGGKYAEILVLD